MALTSDIVQVIVKVNKLDGIEGTRKRVDQYTWANFTPVGHVTLLDHEVLDSKFLDAGDEVIVVSGVDDHGFTADALVERLGSGLIVGEVRRGDARLTGGTYRGSQFLS